MSAVLVQVEDRVYISSVTLADLEALAESNQCVRTFYFVDNWPVSVMCQGVDNLDGELRFSIWGYRAAGSSKRSDALMKADNLIQLLREENQRRADSMATDSDRIGE